jgi:hypothetical protein
MLSLRPLQRGELLIAVGVAALATAAAFGWYVAHGGLAVDDWFFLRAERDPGPGGRLGADGSMWDPSRPLLGVYFLVLYGALGDHAAALLAVAAALTGLLSLLLYVLLRLVGTPTLPAALVSLLVLVSPLADSSTLWITGSQGHAALVLMLAGAVWAVFALRRGAGLAWHLPTLVLFAASILLYEIGALLPVASVGLYLLVAPRRAALQRWGLDVLVVVAATIYNVSQNTKHADGTSVSHTIDVAHGIVTMTQRALEPALTATPVGGLVVLAALVLIVAALRWRPDLRPPAVLALAGVVVIVLGWVILVSSSQYLPTDLLLGNRISASAALGTPMVAVGVAWGLVAAIPQRAVGYGVAAALLVLIGAHEIDGLRDDQRLWARSADGRAAVLAAVDRFAPGSTSVVVRGAETAPVVGIQGMSGGEVSAALAVRRPGASVPAFMDSPAARWRCDRGRAIETASGWTVEYGDGVLVDVAADTGTPIDARTCRSALAH